MSLTEIAPFEQRLTEDEGGSSADDCRKNFTRQKE